jgi:hypothetical protein
MDFIAGCKREVVEFDTLERDGLAIVPGGLAPEGLI